MCIRDRLSLVLINRSFELSDLDFSSVIEMERYTKIFVLDDLMQRNHFIKSFIGGMFITICMTGLDQDMMQKNLTCKTLRAAKTNMIVFSFVLVVVTFLFLILGAMIFTFVDQNQIMIPIIDGSPKTDLIFPEVALNGGLGVGLGVIFILGLIAAAYSSADSALTSLTTSFCIDFIKLDNYSVKHQKKIRKKTHLFMCAVLVLVVILFKHVLDRNVIDGLLTVASYTYGPLLGLFTFGIFTPFKIHDQKVWIVVTVSIGIIFFIANLSSHTLNGYEIGYELLPLNGLITFIGLFLIRKKTKATIE